MKERDRRNRERKGKKWKEWREMVRMERVEVMERERDVRKGWTKPPRPLELDVGQACRVREPLPGAGAAA